MFERVVIQPEQEVTNEDLNRMGIWPQMGIDALTRDLLVSSRLYKGFTVVAKGATAIEIGPGRLYDSGAMFDSPVTETLPVNEFVPFIEGQKVIVTLIVQGREDLALPESRYYEREIPQAGGGTVTQRVPSLEPRAMLRKGILAFIAGAPSSNPQRPGTQLNSAPIADILIGTGGIESITRRTEHEAPELDELARAYTQQSIQIADINQAIGGIRNDLAALGRDLRNTVSPATLRAVAADVARLKDRNGIPDTGSPYGANRYLFPDESDITNVDYKARIEEGVRFPYANYWRGPLALQNPNDPNFMHASQGFICPKYKVVDGIKVDKRAGSMQLGGTTYQTMEMTKLTMSREVTRYGDYFEVCENNSWWQSGQYDPAKGIFRIGNETYEVDLGVNEAYGVGHHFNRLRKFWTDTVQDAYDAYAPVAHTIQGVIKAQSFIQSQDRYTPSVWLGIERWGANAEITATLVENFPNGSPNRSRALCSVKLKANQFKTWPERTLFPWDVPYFISQKQGLYSVVFATTGDVTVATAEGQSFLGGTLFEATDGVFFQGDINKDLCWGLNYCNFTIVRMPVQLAGLNLDGGMHNISIKAGMINPTNSNAEWQLQTGGAWRALSAPGDGDTLFGSGITPFYDFRVMLAGNEWVMPIIDTAASQVEIFRPDDDLREISMPYILGASVTQVKVRATVNNWDDARHTLACRLKIGATYATLKVHDAVEKMPIMDRPSARLIEWTFNLASPIDRFKLDWLGTTNNARIGFLIEEMVFDSN